MVNDQKVVRSVDFAHRESFFSLNPVVSPGKRGDGNAVERISPAALETLAVIAYRQPEDLPVIAEMVRSIA